MKNGLVQPYFSLTKDLKVDFVVVGGGISGALTARSLAIAGASVVLLDKRHIAMGSTSASTALLQYDIDRTLSELIDLMGESIAVRAYELSLKALKDLEQIAAGLALDNDFETRLSIRFAKFKKDVPMIEKEYEVRKQNGFDVELWDAATVAKRFPFSAPAALATRPSATVDPYLLTHGLLLDAAVKGVKIFDKTPVERIERSKNGVTIHTASGHRIKARKVVIACGYESVNYLPGKIGTLNSTFAFVTEPLPQKTPWFENAIFWNTADPYIYCRTTADNRIVFGGEDEPFYDPAKRDALVDSKTNKLSKQLKELFPDIPFKVDYSWAGTFIETDDGLPYIGTIRQLPHTYFALGYGGNGITFSQLAADILTDLLIGKKNADADIFSFDRTTA
ncbi:FAD-dependent oxidoreductase [soil metagenome]